jgi:hypothetical protein
MKRESLTIFAFIGILTKAAPTTFERLHRKRINRKEND